MGCAGQKIRKKTRSVCSGDLRDRITLQNRQLTEPAFGSPDHSLDFQSTRKAWAAINTVTGKTLFDGVSTDVPVTHQITIRYDKGVTSETWILFKGRRFDILAVENLEERNEWLLLTCVDRGSKAQKASAA